MNIKKEKKKTAKSQITQSVKKFIKKWKWEAIHFTEIKYILNDEIYKCDALDFNGHISYYWDRVAWDYMRQKYPYVNGYIYGYHGNANVFLVHTKLVERRKKIMRLLDDNSDLSN